MSTAAKGRRPVAVQSAPLPVDLVLDRQQVRYFGLPQDVETSFREYRGKDISPDYLDGVHTQFAKIVAACRSFPPDAPPRDTRSIGNVSDVVDLVIAIINKNEIQLDWIAVRPCFEGHGTLTLVVYQLVLAARALGFPRVSVRMCCNKTCGVLDHKFDDAVVRSPDRLTPNYTILDVWHPRLSERGLDLTGKLMNNSPFDPSGALWLNPAAFPTAAQLNDANWVSARFRAKYGPLSVQRQLNLDAAPDFDPSATDMEGEFRRTAGPVGPNYVDTINKMLTALGRSFHEYGDSGPWGDDDIIKQTDRLSFSIVTSILKF
jgi:hypothetical protein